MTQVRQPEPVNPIDRADSWNPFGRHFRHRRCTPQLTQAGLESLVRMPKKHPHLRHERIQRCNSNEKGVSR